MSGENEKDFKETNSIYCWLGYKNWKSKELVSEKTEFDWCVASLNKNIHGIDLLVWSTSIIVKKIDYLFKVNEIENCWICKIK